MFRGETAKAPCAITDLPRLTAYFSRVANGPPGHKRGMRPAAHTLLNHIFFGRMAFPVGGDASTMCAWRALTGSTAGSNPAV